MALWKFKSWVSFELYNLFMLSVAENSSSGKKINEIRYSEWMQRIFSAWRTFTFENSNFFFQELVFQLDRSKNGSQVAQK